MKLGGQIRVASGFASRAIGWDFNAAFTLGDALGFDRLAIAELLPEVEAVAMRKLNEQLTEGSDAS